VGQVIRPALLRAGFEKVKAENLAVTDDVSIGTHFTRFTSTKVQVLTQKALLVEQLPAPVKITVGEYTNIKITTPEDMPVLSLLGFTSCFTSTNVLVNLLYYCKSTNTDTCMPADGALHLAAAPRSSRQVKKSKHLCADAEQVLNLLALLVQKCKY
jgi:hypothetical protein